VYQSKFLNTVQVIEQCGASLGEDPMIRTLVFKDLEYSPTTVSATEKAKITKTMRNYTMGTAFILGADPERYSSILRGHKNASLAGRDEWPKNVTEVYNYLSKWEGDDHNGPRARDFEGLHFTTNGERERGPQPWHVKLTCCICNKKGHIAAFCEEEKADTNFQDGEVDEEATAQLLDSVQKDAENED
jgi:hypothetical protein